MAPVRRDLNPGGLTGGSWWYPSEAAHVPMPSESALDHGLGASGLTTGDGSLPVHGGGIVPHDGKLKLTHGHVEQVKNDDTDTSSTSSSSTTLAPSSQPTSSSPLRRRAGVGAVVLGIALAVLSA
ncbi:hypothetical protein A1Q1_06393 [Trichosporon asahii var. asahii CBS 2479]|uniref:Uncharacterized protein n=1 Tax=Trichosporon asahii var. asahii (strain ATCC 90039 / CBS 2479 / JCM 2466 / KCTC 7840 / NBRC 103889/ NCYC 2677 / UAMH 7654) TaxID=1186058 RepID=J4U5I6_TRIAS|nr:hypothetical protein A1Q1_06393 [Trichosporon asahii var. asahii CBS 2479]EJT45255.1 hypothetical protein A1Q1_06393 [Trichosporon asahii var. asahii CBS 2479]